MLKFDHVALPSRTPEASARFLGGLLGGLYVSADGPEGEFMRVDLGDGSFLLYAEAAEVVAQHLAFRVDGPTFTGLLQRLGRSGVPFGNDPDAPRNGRWDDAQGEDGRVYFSDPDGHFLEVVLPRARA